jgi:hypothetical protein
MFLLLPLFHLFPIVMSEIDELLGRFNATRDALIEAAQNVPPDSRETPFAGSWDLKDVIAHTIGWDYTNIEALPDFAAGRLPGFFAEYDADWAAINARLVARYRVADWDALLKSLRASQAAFVAALRNMTDADLDNVIEWNGRRVSLRGMLRAVDRDEREHVRQIREFAAGQRLEHG